MVPSERVIVPECPGVFFRGRDWLCREISAAALQVRMRLPALSRLERIVFSCLIALLLLGAHALAQPPARNEGRPKIGLALSGGGSRGMGHIGVLRALEELRVPIDCIAGTSIGAIVGGLYASGMSPQEIERTFAETDWRYLLSSTPPRESQSIRTRQRGFDLNQNLEFGVSRAGEVQVPLGLIAGRKLLVNLRELTVGSHDVRDFDRLPIPFRAVATDIETGEKVVLGGGNLAEAMRASMAVPGFFAPYRIGDHLLVDGGISSNLPIETVKRMGADIVIAVDLGGEFQREDNLKSALAITNQMLDILMRRETDAQIRQLGARDVYIRLKLPGVTGVSFDGAEKVVSTGYEETMQHAGKLSALKVAPPEFQRHLARQRMPRVTDVEISFVKIDAPTGAMRHELADKLPFKPGERIELWRFDRHLVGLEGMRGHEVIDFELLEESGQFGLLLETRKKTRGPNFLSVGADFAYSTPGTADANLLLGWRMTELNSLGGEWQTLLSIGDSTRVFSEWDQPLTPERRVFLAPALSYASERIDALDADENRRRFRTQTGLASLDAGVRLANFGEARLGYAFGFSDVRRSLNVPGSALGTATRGELRASLLIDTLDRTTFPTTGWFGWAQASVSSDSLGAEDDYRRVEAELFKPITFGKHTLLPRVAAGVRLGGDELPFYDRFALGGFLNLSGFTRADLYDQNTALAELIYYREIARLPAGVGSGVYGGFSVEAGNVWSDADRISAHDLIYAGSIFLGADTVIGPLSIGLGFAEGGHGAIYLNLGPVLGRGRTER